MMVPVSVRRQIGGEAYSNAEIRTALLRGRRAHQPPNHAVCLPDFNGPVLREDAVGMRQRRGVVMEFAARGASDFSFAAQMVKAIAAIQHLHLPALVCCHPSTPKRMAAHS